MASRIALEHLLDFMAEYNVEYADVPVQTP
jgi:hypothetical protein